jgi:hypothetical protein
MYSCGMTRRFSGVDPFIEDQAFWRDFGKSFVVYFSDAVYTDLPANYDARLCETKRSTGDPEVYPLHILNHQTRESVAIIQIVSPSNKTEPGRRDYLSKRNAMLREPVHLVGLDFLLGGRRLPMRSPLPPGDAYAIVSRCETRPDAEVYAWSLRDPLPAIRIPLRAPDPDIVLDLAAVYEETFRRGRYERNLRDDQPLQAPLPAAAVEWIAGRVIA